MTRSEHVVWCKKRALAYVARGDLNQAVTSMGLDLTKHPETANHSGIKLGIMLLFTGALSTPREVTEFIEGFH